MEPRRSALAEARHRALPEPVAQRQHPGARDGIHPTSAESRPPAGGLGCPHGARILGLHLAGARGESGSAGSGFAQRGHEHRVGAVAVRPELGAGAVADIGDAGEVVTGVELDGAGAADGIGDHGDGFGQMR